MNQKIENDVCSSVGEILNREVSRCLIRSSDERKRNRQKTGILGYEVNDLMIGYGLVEL